MKTSTGSPGSRSRTTRTSRPRTPLIPARIQRSLMRGAGRSHLPNEPCQLVRGPDLDFVACAPSMDMHTVGPGSRYDAYWGEFCRAVGFSLEALGTVRVHREDMVTRTFSQCNSARRRFPARDRAAVFDHQASLAGESSEPVSNKTNSLWELG